MRLTTLSFFLLFSLSLSAQYDRGQAYLAGDTYGYWERTDFQFPTGTNRPTANTTALFSSFRTGYFPFERLLIGAGLDYFRSADPNSSISNGFGRLLLSPFARYYLLADPERRVNLFGELGFGTVGIGDAEGFETDFHLGAGAEFQLRPGILGTANLNYNANAAGLNYTTLDLGCNVLTGQLAAAGLPTRLAPGTLTARGSLGNISYGRMQRGEAVDTDFTLVFTPSLGYFVAPGVLLEFGINTIISRQSNKITPGSMGIRDRSYWLVDLTFDARYYPLPQGRLLPYLTAGVRQRYQRQVFTAHGSRSDRDGTSGLWRAGGGLSYFLSPHLALDAAAHYEDRYDSFLNFRFLPDELSYNRVRLTAGLRFFLPRG